MGIQNSVVARYGQDYWDKNKKDILRTANRHGQLESERIHPNARERRKALRLEEQREEIEEEEIPESFERRGHAVSVIRDRWGKFKRWLVV